MSDIVERLREVQKLGGDTFSSYEVIGMIGQAADEIERLRAVEECANIAFDYHMTGYERDTDFDADTMLELMNQLGRALERK